MRAEGDERWNEIQRITEIVEEHADRLLSGPYNLSVNLCGDSDVSFTATHILNHAYGGRWKEEIVIKVDSADTLTNPDAREVGYLVYWTEHIKSYEYTNDDGDSIYADEEINIDAECTGTTERERIIEGVAEAIDVVESPLFEVNGDV